MSPYSSSVFLNVPFDNRYRKLLHALVFGVHDCGLIARCALEADDGGEVRVEKLYRMVEQCRFGIHDLSRTTLDSTHHLPRFNMPLELGLFLGARRFGTGRQRSKSCLVLERHRYRSQIYCSDIAGQDVRAHNNDVAIALTAVRNWLQAALPRNRQLPGPATMRGRYLQFRRQLPLISSLQHLGLSELTFLDYRHIVDGWISVNPR